MNLRPEEISSVIKEQIKRYAAVLLSNTLEERFMRESISRDIRLQTRMDSAKM